ncbi:MAG: recombination mediator protein UvsY [Candidatus Dormibacteria bacterium]
MIDKSPLENILDAWDNDAQIEPSEPGEAMLNIPKLHAKYSRILSKCSLLSRKYDQDIIALRKVKSDYFNGRLTQAELDERGWKPFKFVLKSDVREYIDADSEIMALVRKKVNQDEMVALCTSILKELGARTWQLTSYIKWQQIMLGK